MKRDSFTARENIATHKADTSGIDGASVDLKIILMPSAPIPSPVMIRIAESISKDSSSIFSALRLIALLPERPAFIPRSTIIQLRASAQEWTASDTRECDEEARPTKNLSRAREQSHSKDKPEARLQLYFILSPVHPMP